MSLLFVSFFISGFLIVYHHAIYPVLLVILSRHLEPLSRRSNCLDLRDDLPTMGIVIPAFNEEKFVADKLRNFTYIDYPSDRWSVLLVCDGCTDETVEIARKTLKEPEFLGLNIEVIENKENRGKLAIINSYIPQVRADIIALSDVSSLISMDALKVASERFNDSSVGAINGNYRLLNPGSGGEKDYWRYQGVIKRGEEFFGSILGAHGAFYLFRKSLFRELPLDTINDDFILPMNIVRQGYRVVYEDRINAIELEQSDSSLNWHRRIRIGMGNAQQIIRLKDLFIKQWRGVGFSLASGKGLRVLMPFIMTYSLISSFILSSNSSFCLLVLLLQLLAYSMALSSWIIGEDKSCRINNTLFYLVSGYAASAVGVVRYACNCKRVW